MKTDLVERMEKALLKLKAQNEQDKVDFGGKRLTYDMWKSYGFQVTEGQRPVKRIRSGNYLFTFDQVVRIGSYNTWRKINSQVKSAKKNVDNCNQ